MPLAIHSSSSASPAVSHRQKPTRRQGLLSPASLQGPGDLSSLPCQTRCLVLFPPLPTQLCTFSCPRRRVLCNGFLRKPHRIRSLVRKYLLLPGGAGEIREELSVWKQAISHWSNGICQYFHGRLAPLLQGCTCVLSLREAK